MDSFLKTFGAAVAITALIVVLMILAPVIGAMLGFAFSVVFPGTAAAMLAAMGLTEIAFWQFGAFMGFVGSFLAPRNIVKNGGN